MLEDLLGECLVAHGIAQRLLKVFDVVGLVDIGMFAPHGLHPIVKRLARKVLANREIDSSASACP